MEKNKTTYSDPKIVNYYEKYDGLQKPEQTIFDLLKKDLSGIKMLDIGIDGGRTSAVFAPYVKEYTGVDYADEMVEICKNKFRIKFPAAVFKVADVRDLTAFASSKFNLILFSFNGIDYISAEERKTALEQIKNSLTPGGYFCFSSHNIQSLAVLGRFELRLNLFALIKKMFDTSKVKRMNKIQLENAVTADYVLINDGAHDFRLLTCFFRPSAQVKMLEEAGFKNIRCFSLDKGTHIKTADLSTSNDKWIYYLCEKN